MPIIETILLLGRQELSFRGHRGESRQLNIEEPKENDGNFHAAKITPKSRRHCIETSPRLQWIKFKIFEPNDPERDHHN